MQQFNVKMFYEPDCKAIQLTARGPNPANTGCEQMINIVLPIKSSQ